MFRFVNNAEVVHALALLLSHSIMGLSNKMMKNNRAFKLITASLAVSALVVGCGNLNSTLAARHETVEMYHIFDVKTASAPDVVIKAAADGLARNTNSVTQSRPLQIGVKIPDKPGRFELVNMADAFQGIAIGSLMGGAGTATMRVAKCDDAVWSSKAVRHISGSNNLNLFTCLYRYKDGYAINMYAVFQKVSGGGLSDISRVISSALIGEPEEWVNKTIIDTVRSIESRTNAPVVHLEGQPELGDLPDVDKIDARPS